VRYLSALLTYGLARKVDGTGGTGGTVSEEGSGVDVRVRESEEEDLRIRKAIVVADVEIDRMED
jgi:hypothetical protein